MRFVLDASVGLKTLLPEQDSDKALKLRDEYSQGLHELLAPDVFAVEVSHALTRAERARVIQVGDSIGLYGQLLATMPDLHESFPLMPRAIELSSKLRASVYDCLYVSLAERESCQLVTSDKRLINVFQKDFPNIVDLVDLP